MRAHRTAPGTRSRLGAIVAMLLAVGGVASSTPLSGQTGGPRAHSVRWVAGDVADRTPLRGPAFERPGAPSESGSMGYSRLAETPGARDLLASALVPGTGQLLSGRRRGWVMLGLDALLLTGWGLERSAGRSDRDRYRDLAWSVARAGITPRLDGDWEYYERMGKWLSSGVFDRDATLPGVQPETRTDTFNGDAWRLARALFLEGGEGAPGTPEWDAAVAWYGDRAYGDAFLWDWTGESASRDRFLDLIDTSDDHMRRAGWAVAAAVGLRVVSVLDLWVASRSGGRAGMDLRARPDGRLDASVRWTPSHTGHRDG